MSNFWVGSMAVDSPRIVLVATEDERIDWPAYSRSVLGEDHGQLTGEGGDPTAWTVSFEDGFEVTVDLVAAGLPVPSPPQGATVLTHDGTDWLEPVDIPLSGPDMSAPSVVAGPAGFVLVTSSVAFVSRDGLTWEPHPLPASRGGLDGAADRVLCPGRTTWIRPCR